MSERDGKYRKISQGESVLFRSGHSLRFACCDCGLVHDIVVRPRGGGWFVLAAFRSRATGGHRRRKGLPAELRALADRLEP